MTSSRAEQPPVFDIPRLEKITIDGQVNDWGTNGFRVDAMVDSDGVARPASEFASRFRLGWDDRGLLVLVTVHDSTPVEEKNDAQFYLCDSVEMFIADQYCGQQAFQVVFVPGRIAGQRELRFHVYDRRVNDELKKTSIAIEAARTANAENYTLEVRVPWQNLGIKPEIGREIVFQLYVNDARPVGPRLQNRWYPEVRDVGNTRLMYRLRLAEQPSSAAVVAAGASYERLRRTQVGVVATGALTGQVITVRTANQELGSGSLITDGDGSRLHLNFPMPARGKPYGPLTVQLAGQTFATLQLPDADEARQQAFARAEFNFTPCVFSGETFPPCDFQQPSLVEDAVGPYRISKVTFYDADFNVVTTATKPGRYGAIIEICTADGQIFKKFKTLFRQTAECKWKDAKLRVVELPPEVGIDPEVVREQAATLNDYLREEVVAGFQRNANGAIVLAGLSETAAGSSPAHRQNNAQERTAEWWYRLKKQIGEVAPLQYLTYLPENYDSVSTQRWPVVLFLHGSGERGSDLTKVKINGLPYLIEAGKHFPFITIAPQCPSNEWWNVMALCDLLDEVVAKYHVDSDRVYLTGLSMGGYGTWSLATRFPERFAAIVPICGGGDPEAAADIKNIPVWVFHGAKDRVVPPQRSQEMVDALQKLGAPVHFTLYPDANHNSWTPAYATEELYTWLLQQHRGEPPAH